MADKDGSGPCGALGNVCGVTSPRNRRGDPYQAEGSERRRRRKTMLRDLPYFRCSTKKSGHGAKQAAKDFSRQRAYIRISYAVFCLKKKIIGGAASLPIDYRSESGWRNSRSNR